MAVRHGDRRKAHRNPSWKIRNAKKAFEDKNLHPVNLSRTLEDTGTVTSVLIPWNTCGAYNAGVLGVPTVDYAFYAIFNWISPFMTLTVAALGYKIKELAKGK